MHCISDCSVATRVRSQAGEFSSNTEGFAAEPRSGASRRATHGKCCKAWSGGALRWGHHNTQLLRSAHSCRTRPVIYCLAASAVHEQQSRRSAVSCTRVTFEACLLQVDSSRGTAFWGHPLDLHLVAKVGSASSDLSYLARTACASNACFLHPVERSGMPQGLAGWPKLHFQVWSRQTGGRAQIREIFRL